MARLTSLSSVTQTAKPCKIHCNRPDTPGNNFQLSKHKPFWRSGTPGNRSLAVAATGAYGNVYNLQPTSTNSCAHLRNRFNIRKLRRGPKEVMAANERSQKLTRQTLQFFNSCGIDVHNLQNPNMHRHNLFLQLWPRI